MSSADSPAPASPAPTRPETLTLDSPVIGKAVRPYFSVRTANALANAGKRTVGAVLAMAEEELVRVRDLGPVGWAQVDQLRTAIDGPLCPITATIDATTRRCGNARGHLDDCWFLSNPDGSLASSPEGPEPLKASGLTEREELECNMLDFAEPSDPPASDAPAPPREETEDPIITYRETIIGHLAARPAQEATPPDDSPNSLGEELSALRARGNVRVNDPRQEATPPRLSKEWCLAAAEREGDGVEVGAGGMDDPAWRLTRARSALECYGRHHPWCDYRKPIPEGKIALPCNCGYEQAIKDAASRAAPTPEATPPREVCSRNVTAMAGANLPHSDTMLLDHLDSLPSGITINGDARFPGMGMTPKQAGFSHIRDLIRQDIARRATAAPTPEATAPTLDFRAWLSGEPHRDAAVPAREASSAPREQDTEFQAWLTTLEDMERAVCTDVPLTVAPGVFAALGRHLNRLRATVAALTAERGARAQGQDHQQD